MYVADSAPGLSWLNNTSSGSPIRYADLGDCVCGVQGKLKTQQRFDIVSSNVQIVRNQVTTDQKLIGLVGTMESVYSFVDAIQSNVAEKVKVLEDVIKKILAQTIECSMFIQEYFKQGGFAGNIMMSSIEVNAC